MSYILEALKKSEQERQRRAPASTQMTDHSAPSVAISDVSAVASSNRLLIIILFVVSTLFGGLIIYGLMRTTIDSSSAIDAPAEQNSNASIPLTTHQLVTPQVSTLPPDSVLAKIPTLDFQGHLYSSYGSKSYVIINTKRWQQGDIIAPEVVLTAITPSGITITVDGWDIPVNRSRGWQAGSNAK